VISEVTYLTGLIFDVVMPCNHSVLSIVYIAHVKVNARIASPINSQTVVQADSCVKQSSLPPRGVSGMRTKSPVALSTKRNELVNSPH